MNFNFRMKLPINIFFVALLFFLVSVSGFSAPPAGKTHKASLTLSDTQKKTPPAPGDACKMPPASGDACKISPADGKEKVCVCKHCGCRMKYSEKDLDKKCTACKCGKKIRECIFKK